MLKTAIAELAQTHPEAKANVVAVASDDPRIDEALSQAVETLRISKRVVLHNGQEHSLSTLEDDSVRVSCVLGSATLWESTAREQQSPDAFRDAGKLYALVGWEPQAREMFAKALGLEEMQVYHAGFGKRGQGTVPAKVAAYKKTTAAADSALRKKRDFKVGDKQHVMGSGTHTIHKVHADHVELKHDVTGVITKHPKFMLHNRESSDDTDPGLEEAVGVSPNLVKIHERVLKLKGSPLQVESHRLSAKAWKSGAREDHLSAMNSHLEAHKVHPKALDGNTHKSHAGMHRPHTKYQMRSSVELVPAWTDEEEKAFMEATQGNQGTSSRVKYEQLRDKHRALLASADKAATAAWGSVDYQKHKDAAAGFEQAHVAAQTLASFLAGVFGPTSPDVERVQRLAKEHERAQMMHTKEFAQGNKAQRAHGVGEGMEEGHREYNAGIDLGRKHKLAGKRMKLGSRHSSDFQAGYNTSHPRHIPKAQVMGKRSMEGVEEQVHGATVEKATEGMTVRVHNPRMPSWHGKRGTVHTTDTAGHFAGVKFKGGKSASFHVSDLRHHVEAADGSQKLAEAKAGKFKGGYTKKRLEKVVKKLKGKKGIDNPYAVAHATLKGSKYAKAQKAESWQKQLYGS